MSELLGDQHWDPYIRLTDGLDVCYVPCNDQRIGRATAGTARDIAPVHAAGVLRTRFRRRIHVLAASDGANDGVEHTYPTKIRAGDWTRCGPPISASVKYFLPFPPSPRCKDIAGYIRTRIRRHISAENRIIGISPCEQSVRGHSPAYPGRLRRFRREPHPLCHRPLIRARSRRRTGPWRFDPVYVRYYRGERK